MGAARSYMPVAVKWLLAGAISMVPLVGVLPAVHAHVLWAWRGTDIHLFPVLTAYEKIRLSKCVLPDTGLSDIGRGGVEYACHT